VKHDPAETVRSAAKAPTSGPLQPPQAVPPGAGGAGGTGGASQGCRIPCACPRCRRARLLV